MPGSRIRGGGMSFSLGENEDNWRAKAAKRKADEAGIASDPPDSVELTAWLYTSTQLPQTHRGVLDGILLLQPASGEKGTALYRVRSACLKATPLAPPRQRLLSSLIAAPVRHGFRHALSQHLEYPAVRRAGHLAQRPLRPCLPRARRYAEDYYRAAHRVGSHQHRQESRQDRPLRDHYSACRLGADHARRGGPLSPRAVRHRAAAYHQPGSQPFGGRQPLYTGAQPVGRSFPTQQPAAVHASSAADASAVSGRAVARPRRTGRVGEPGARALVSVPWHEALAGGPGLMGRADAAA